MGTPNPKPVIGLVGGIGSGKSSVAALLARDGARIVAGDPLGHEALRQPAIRDQVVERWGSGVLDGQGEIDRRRLGAIVFADPGERQALEALVFPWIQRRLGEEVAKAAADPEVRLIVVDAAVMLEAGWDHLCDRLIYVDAPRDVRLRRLAQQRRWTAEELAARERAQMPLEDKARRADGIVDNTGPPERTAAQVRELLRGWGMTGV